MKRWICLTCPICARRYQLGKFNSSLKYIDYPAQLVSGGGRGSGFKALRYLPWSALPELKGTQAWNSIIILYNRLGFAYDSFYRTLGWLSPEIDKMLKGIARTYADIYQRDISTDYARIYSATNSSDDIVASYSEGDYSQVYARADDVVIPRGA